MSKSLYSSNGEIVLTDSDVMFLNNVLFHIAHLNNSPNMIELVCKNLNQKLSDFLIAKSIQVTEKCCNEGHCCVKDVDENKEVIQFHDTVRNRLLCSKLVDLRAIQVDVGNGIINQIEFDYNLKQMQLHLVSDGEGIICDVNSLCLKQDETSGKLFLCVNATSVEDWDYEFEITGRWHKGWKNLFELNVIYALTNDVDDIYK